MNKIYIKKLNTYLSKFEGKFYISGQNNVCFVNEIGARIYDLCNGTNTIEEIAKKLIDIYDTSLAELQDDVINYVDMLLTYNIVEEKISK